jgi:hypothetical protein
LWAYEFEVGKFIAGEILGDTLYMYAPTGRGEKWVMNSEGVVLEYSSEPFHKSDEIIAGINAHYGTSFYQEDDIDKDFTIGETMPNWNAYEKISDIRWAILYTGASGVFGIIENDTYKVYCSDANTVQITSNEGVIVGSQYYTSDFANFMKQKLVTAGVNVESVEQLISSLNQGDNVPDWSLYNIAN